jgi:hypothetical protein
MFSTAGVTEAGQAIWHQRHHRTLSKNIGLRKRVARSIQEVDVTTPAGLYLGRAMTIRPDELRSERFVSKIVRGLYYLEYGSPLSPKVQIMSRRLRGASDANHPEKIKDQLLVGSHQRLGVIEYRFNRVEDQPNGSMWVIRFFGRVVFWCISAENGERRSTTEGKP